MIKARPSNQQAILSERLTVGRQESGTPLRDSHGNSVLWTVLEPGVTLVQYDAILIVPRDFDPPEFDRAPGAKKPRLLNEVLRYSLPSRYCESDKLGALASRLFGHYPEGLATAQAICEWTHRNIEYRYGSGDATLSASEAITRGYGVCRDYAHVMIALCRALDMPTRYVAGYMPLFEATDSDIGIDFHAYVEDMWREHGMCSILAIIDHTLDELRLPMAWTQSMSLLQPPTAVCQRRSSKSGLIP